MAAKRGAKKTTKKASKKSSAKAPPRSRKTPTSATAQPTEPSTEQVTEAASDAIQSSLAETHRVIEANLASFRQELQSVQTFVERAVGDMQLNQADALQRVTTAAEPTTTPIVPTGGNEDNETMTPPSRLSPHPTGEILTGTINLDDPQPMVGAPSLDLEAAMQAAIACEESVSQSDFAMQEGDISLEAVEAPRDVEWGEAEDLAQHLEAEAEAETDAEIAFSDSAVLEQYME